ncbi:MAG: von Willebrand factor type [Chloroflexi bacterium]|jgi:Ca-activated chloride channel family protein|nr:von Willebrand factor type [Chloroflexota bacterium]
MPTTLEIESAYAQIPVASPAANYTAITIRPDITVQARPQVQIGLVIDTSGSMDGQIRNQKKIDLVKAAATNVINQLQDGDAVCLIAFSDRVQILVPATVVSGDRSRLLNAIRNLRADGGTLMGDGIAAAQQQFFALPAQSAVRKIVVLTDGQTNDEDRCYQLAEQTQIPLMLGGIGDDYNGRLLNEMARSARGIAEYIDRSEAVGDFFKEVLVTVQSTVVTNAVLSMDFRQRFRPKRIHQVSPELKSFDFVPVTPTSRHTEIQVGDIQREGMTILVEYVYEGGAGFASEFQVATLSLRFDQPPQSGLEIRSDDFTIQLADITGFPAMNPEVKQFIDHAAVETAQTQLLQAAQAGDVSVATQKLNVLQQSLERVGADPNFIQQTVSTMRLQLKDAGNATAISDSSATKKLTSGTRKLVLPQNPDQGS